MGHGLRRYFIRATFFIATTALAGCFDFGDSADSGNGERTSAFVDLVPSTAQGPQEETPPTTGDATPTTPGDNQPPAGPSNSAPTIAGSPSPNAVIGSEWAFTPTASDPNNDTLIFSIQNRPAWAQFDPTSGRLSGQPEQGDSAVYGNIVISVSDGNMVAALPAFEIIVSQSANGSVTLSWTPPDQNEDGSPLVDLAAYKIYYGIQEGDYPNQIDVNNAGVTNYVVDNLPPNTYFFVSTSVNSRGVESDFSNIASITVN